MDIRVTGKNMSVTEGIRDHLRTKLSKFGKYDARLIESHVILKKEKYFFVAEVTLLAKHLRAYGEGTSKDNVFTAIDQAAVRVEKQLKKFREKIKDHHKKDGHFGAAIKAARRRAVEIPEDFPRVVKMKSMSAKQMSVEEASLQLELSAKPFLVFQNSTTQQVNVLFKREDGQHGLIEPDFN